MRVSPYTPVVLKLLALFVLVPVVELALLIELGSRIGTLSTLGLIVFTGLIGALLARTQGLGVWGRIRKDLADGHVPADALLDGVLILFAGAVLMTPGIITDAAGFLCLVPAFRRWLKRLLRKRFERAVREGRAHMSFHVSGVAPSDDRGPATPRHRVIDVEAKPSESNERE